MEDQEDKKGLLERSVALLTKIKDYNEGNGKYNFATLDESDYNNVVFDEWMKIKAEIDLLLSDAKNAKNKSLQTLDNG